MQKKTSEAKISQKENYQVYHDKIVARRHHRDLLLRCHVAVSLVLFVLGPLLLCHVFDFHVLAAQPVVLGRRCQALGLAVHLLIVEGNSIGEKRAKRQVQLRLLEVLLFSVGEGADFHRFRERGGAIVTANKENTFYLKQLDHIKIPRRSPMGFSRDINQFWYFTKLFLTDNKTI